MPSLSLTREDLAPFADLGTNVESIGEEFILFRNGEEFRIHRDGDGYIVVGQDGISHRRMSAGHLLAQSPFANLHFVARNQSILLSPTRISGEPVPLTTSLTKVLGEALEFPQLNTPWLALDQWLHSQQVSQGLGTINLLLIDGPAGVGKTTIIREVALKRAENYDGKAPIIIQIASRGRVLQNISDLIAFALQDLRSNLTVSQLVSLLRHGLVTLAIDGFDELSDPNGFETAWTGLNDLLGSARGLSTFLLAGRETFVSTDTMRRQMKAIDPDRGDRLAALSLADPDATEARKWLLLQDGWSHELLQGDFVAPLFTEGSYALRPFFLDLIARNPDALSGDAPPASDLLSYLVEVMTRREAGKFVEQLDPPEGDGAANIYGIYVGRFLEEVARELAENQSEAISEDALDLIATVAADGVLPSDQVRAVVQRARTVVFLAKDIQVGHVRFAHEQMLQHFLAREALRSVGNGETPKYIRRNLFGREALDVFAHVARDRGEDAQRFLGAVQSGLSRPARDRTHTNLAVLGVAAMCAAAPEGLELQVQDIGIGELHFPFTAPRGITFIRTPISILYAAGSDIREVNFKDGVSISTLEIDRRSILPKEIPYPQILVQLGETIADRKQIIKALAPHHNEGGLADRLPWPDDLNELLGRIDRYRSFWLRTSGEVGHGRDRIAQKLISHPEWPRVLDALKKLELVTVRTLGASGARSDFVHFRQDSLMLENKELYSILLGK